MRPNGRSDVSYHLKKGDIALDETNGPVLNNVCSCYGNSLEVPLRRKLWSYQPLVVVLLLE